jgi:2-polyprenyl-3-methyl-5-hydroxy-6-metoxy-1,4-benzoquinol methylase
VGTRFKPSASGVVHEDDAHRQEAFVDIFRNRLWVIGMPNPDNISVSGPGSTLEATVVIRTTLNHIIRDIKSTLNKKVVRILDIPCGDMGWMSVFLKDRSDIDYTGMDIVPDLIRNHKHKYADRLNWQFAVHDIVANPLSAPYDLIFSRDMTQHLTSGDTMRVLYHF